MAIQTSKTDIHWNYFLSIEDDLMKLSRFIEFDSKNFEAFSLENARILMAAASETDVVCKLICKTIDPSSTADNIHNYRSEITPVFHMFSSFEVLMGRYGLQLKPWENFNNQNGVPDWWTANNKVKHERDSFYHLASLKNVLNAAAGLYVACLYLHKDTFMQLRPSSKCFQPLDIKPGSSYIEISGGQPILV